MGSVENLAVIKSISTHISEIVESLRAHTQEVKDDLANNYYNKETIQQLFASGIKTQFVDELPETGTEGIIYLVPVASADINLETEYNIYKEYMWVDTNLFNGTTDAEPNYAWEALGSTELDLDSYYSKTALQPLLEAKQDLMTVPTKLSELTDDISAVKLVYVDTLPATGVDNTIYITPAPTTYDTNNVCNEYIWLNNKFESIAPADVVLKAELDNYYLKTETYSNTEIDTAFNEMSEYVNNKFNFEISGAVQDDNLFIDVGRTIEQATDSLTTSNNELNNING